MRTLLLTLAGAVMGGVIGLAVISTIELYAARKVQAEQRQEQMTVPEADFDADANPELSV